MENGTTENKDTFLDFFQESEDFVQGWNKLATDVLGIVRSMAMSELEKQLLDNIVIRMIWISSAVNQFHLLFKYAGKPNPTHKFFYQNKTAI